MSVCVQGVGLLTNLVEHSAVNRERLIKVECAVPYNCHYDTDSDLVDCLEALGMVTGCSD